MAASKVSSRARNDRDLIIALASDYLNVYVVRPQESQIDVVKLDGYNPEGLDEFSENYDYDTLLGAYTASRVFHEDREMFLKALSRESLVASLSRSKLYQGSYRVIEGDDSQYFQYKIVRMSAEGEPIRAVAAFRNIDAIVTENRRKMSELEELRRLKDATDMGTWHIILKDGHEPRMTADAKMKELLGLEPDSEISEEQMYRRWFSRIDVNARESVEQSVKAMMEGRRDENTYKWFHPTLGERFVRCGGTAVAIDGGYVLSGYHYDVTDQITKNIRSNLIINSLASSYEFLFYVRLYDMTYITYTDKVFGDDSDRDAPEFKDVDDLLDRSVSLISDEFKDEMVQFMDLSTINERMTGRNILIRQFKDINGTWYEWSYIAAERHLCGKVKHLLLAVRKIDDEKQAELRRQRLLEDNIAANKAKTMFLQNMSHEIRTPLNAMFGFSQLLGLPEGSWTEEERDQYNRYIYNSYNMLDMLIGDIIDIADSEHGNYRIQISDVEVNSICRNAIMSVEYRKPLSVNMYYTSDIPDDYIIRSDARRIQQVLINYLTNACKHTQQGEIHLHCSSSEHPGKLTFSVTDTGDGVPADKADVIFNRFTKLNQFAQGSGLGLNICLMVASKLGGEVYLDTSYHDGARFVFVVGSKEESET